MAHDKQQLCSDSARRLLSGLAFAGWFWVASAANGQVAVAVEAAAETAAEPTTAEADAANSPNQSFVLPAQPNDVKEALEDFTRYVKRGTWEKAFKSLDKIAASAGKGLVPRRDGVMVPAQVLVRQSLAELPAEGKKAYRLFNDAQARKLLEQAQGKDEADKLAQVVSAHLISTVGDAAANRLGDLYFEQGAIDRAIDTWQTILNYLPDSTVPRPELLVKIGIGLARSGRWTEFQDVRRQLDERYKGESVVLGGKRVVAAEHLASLAKSAPAISVESGEPADITLPESNDPLWQFRLPAGPGANANNAQLMGRGFWNGNEYGNMAMAEMVLPIVADGDRVYSTVLGCDVAIDIHTGKLLWRSAKYHDLRNKVQQNPYLFPERYGITQDKDRVWVVARQPDQIGVHAAMFYLTAREKATGKQTFWSKNVKDLQTWSLIGRPASTGDTVYATAVKQNQGSQLFVIAFSTADSKLRWSTQLGTTKFDPEQMYYQRTSQPSLVQRDDKLYVETHSGALMAMDASTGAILWAISYPSQIPQNQWGWGYRQSGSFVCSGPPLFVGGVLYSKGMMSNRLLSLLPSGPAVVWRRPVNEAETIIGLDDKRLYTGGAELAAYDVASRPGKNGPQMLWSASPPQGTSWARPILTKSRIYQFTPRGIFEFDKESGNRLRIFRGADLDSLGGTILVTSQAIITASNSAITAYPIGGSPDPSKTAAAPAPSNP